MKKAALALSLVDAAILILILVVVMLCLPFIAPAQNLPDYQNQVPDVYKVTRQDTLSGSAAVVTVQTGASSRKVQMKFVSVYSSAALTFEIERNGSAATGTELTVLEENPGGPSSSVSAYHTSNAGDVAGVVYDVVAEGTMVVVLTDHFLLSAGENITIRTNSITGTVRINPKWLEY